MQTRPNYLKGQRKTVEQHIILGFRFLIQLTRHTKLISKRGTNFWTKSIKKEMDNVRVALEVLKGVTPYQTREGKVKLGFKYVGTHMIVDIRMDSKFICKARLVAGVNNMAPPSFITYSSVVTRDSVRL